MMASAVRLSIVNSSVISAPMTHSVAPALAGRAVRERFELIAFLDELEGDVEGVSDGDETDLGWTEGAKLRLRCRTRCSPVMTRIVARAGRNWHELCCRS
jgi:hypothetical protein